MRQILLALALLASAWSAPLTGNKITADGTYTVTTTPGKRYVFSASGTFGSGSLAINWTDTAGTNTAFANSPATAAETWTFTAPTSTVSLVLSGSTNPSITVGVTLAGTAVDIGADDIADPQNLPISDATQTALDGKARKSDVTQLRKRVCGTRSRVCHTKLSGGSTQTETSSFVVRMTDDASDIQIGFANPGDGLPVTIKCAVSISGTVYPLHFNGQRTKLIDLKGIAFTDPLGVKLAKGTDITVRTFSDAGSGNTVQPNLENYSSGLGGKIANVDYADSGTITAATAYMFGPSLVIGKCANPCVAYLGDSIGDGSNNTLAVGWFRQKYGSFASNSYHAGKDVNILHLAVSGRTAEPFASDWWWQTQLLQFADIAVVELGVNDLLGVVTTETMQARLQALWDTCYLKGMKVWAVTMTTKTTSTDSWATTANQTPTNGTNFTTIRSALNTWIKTTPSPLVGYIDLASGLMDATSTNVWKAGYTTDGLHPSQANSTVLNAMTATIPSDVYTRGF